jgi:hypothetical protein
VAALAGDVAEPLRFPSFPRLLVPAMIESSCPRRARRVRARHSAPEGCQRLLVLNGRIRLRISPMNVTVHAAIAISTNARGDEHQERRACDGGEAKRADV